VAGTAQGRSGKGHWLHQFRRHFSLRVEYQWGWLDMALSYVTVIA
jgi:hypothetical protein